jgi:hypothetical protein
MTGRTGRYLTSTTWQLTLINTTRGHVPVLDACDGCSRALEISWIKQ